MSAISLEPCVAARGLVHELVTSVLDAGTCFVYGAFVLEDPEHRVYNLLRGCPGTYRRYTDLVHATHGAFIHGLHFNAQVAVDRKTAQSGQWELPLNPPITKLCAQFCTDETCLSSSQSVHKRVALFYKFAVWDRRDGVQRQYLYMKLEDHPYYAPQHAVAAFKRYVVNTPNVHSTFPSHREEEAFHTFSKPAGDPETIYYNKNIRSGNEMFLTLRQYQHVT